MTERVEQETDSLHKGSDRPLAVITGASGDIGRAVARKFAEEDWRLLLHYHQSEARAQALQAELQAQGTDVHLVQADLRSASGAAKLIAAKEQFFSAPIACLVNVAGLAHSGLLQDLDDDLWREVMAANVDSTFYVCRAFLPELIRAHQGSIVNVSSIWGVAGASMEVAYSTAKAALHGFTKALAKELGPSGVRVNCVAPGVIDGRMNQAYGKETLEDLAYETPLGRLGKPEEIASLVYVLATDLSSFVTGQVLVADGGFLNG